MVEVWLDRVAPTPWRNGGGRTRELLARPAGPEWTIRISVADIEAEGPFSSFPGVQRWFAVVSGGGVALYLPDRTLSVRAGDAPICFDGGAPPGCRLLAGPVRDLNLMVKGDSGLMEPIRSGAGWASPLGFRALFAAQAGVLHNAEERDRPVRAGTLLADLPEGPIRFVATNPGPIGWWLAAGPPGQAA